VGVLRLKLISVAGEPCDVILVVIVVSLIEVDVLNLDHFVKHLLNSCLLISICFLIVNLDSFTHYKLIVLHVNKRKL
jgi:hypothetical protein